MSRDKIIILITRIIFTVGMTTISSMPFWGLYALTIGGENGYFDSVDWMFYLTVFFGILYFVVKFLFLNKNSS